MTADLACSENQLSTLVTCTSLQDWVAVLWLAGCGLQRQHCTMNCLALPETHRVHGDAFALRPGDQVRHVQQRIERLRLPREALRVPANQREAVGCREQARGGKDTRGVGHAVQKE